MLVEPGRARGGRYGNVNGQRTWRRSKTTVEGLRRCSVCKQDKPADLEHYGVRRWEDKAAKRVRYWKSECRRCHADAEKVRAARLQGDPRRKEQIRRAGLAYKARGRAEARRQRAEADGSYAYGPEPVEPRLRVAIESFRPHWERMLVVAHARFVQRDDMRNAASKGTSAREGAFDTQAFADWLGVEHDEYVRVQEYMKPSRVGQTATLDFWLCERVLTGAGLPHVVNQLYVVKRS